LIKQKLNIIVVAASNYTDIDIKTSKLEN